MTAQGSRVLQFYKYSPSGNITILVLDALVPASERADIARVLMSGHHLGAEQVGYIDSARGRIDMMGGELCVNACRAAACLLYSLGALPECTRPSSLSADESDWIYGEIESSGISSKISVRLRPSGKYSYAAGVRLTLPSRPRAENIEKDIWLYRLPGIVHLVIEATLPEDVIAASRDLRNRFSLLGQEAVGCLWLDAKKLKMLPVVWVRDTQEEHLETACGSGTLACALHLLDTHGTVNILQPGGEKLSATLVNNEDETWHAWIEGSVTCIASGHTYIT